MSLLWMLAAAGAAPATVPSNNNLEEVIVACSRLGGPVSDLGANVTVLSRDDFDAEKPTQLADVLRNVAGLHLDQVGGRGGTGSLYLRGADPNYTLVLVNGVRVNDPTNARGGSFDFSTFDIGDVERIEVARGPYSAVYGGDAMAGVINIVTHQQPGAEVRTSAEAMAGAYGTHNIELRGGSSLGMGDWNLGVSDSAQGEVVRGNSFDSRRISGGYDGMVGDVETHVFARYADSERDGFPDDSGGYEFAAIRDTEHRESHESIFGAGFDHDTQYGKARLTLGYFDRGERIDSPGVAPGIRDPFGVPPNLVDSDIERFSATLTGTYESGKAIDLAYGVDYQHEQGASNGQLDFGGGFVLPTSFDLTRSSWAPFAEARLHLGEHLSAQAGVRVDMPEDYSSVTSPRLRMAYDAYNTGDGKFTIAAAWGKAFKLPSLYALGHPLVGNPDLLPERGESYEFELSQDLLESRAHWSATWFDGQFQNAIDFDSGPPPMLVNRNRVDTQGFELDGRLALVDQWQFDASVTQAKSRIASSGNELRNRPEWRAGAGVHWLPTSALKFTGTVSYVGSSLDSSIATGDVRLPAYTHVDVAASWQLSKKLETWLAVENLTDQQYEQFVGFEVRGIMPRLGVRFSL